MTLAMTELHLHLSEKDTLFCSRPPHRDNLRDCHKAVLQRCTSGHRALDNKTSREPPPRLDTLKIELKDDFVIANASCIWGILSSKLTYPFC